MFVFLSPLPCRSPWLLSPSLWVRRWRIQLLTSKVVLFRLPLRPSFPFNANPWCPNVIITCYATTRWESSSSSRDRTQIAAIVICPPADEMLVWRSVKLPALNDQTRNESADSAAARDLMPARQRMPVSMLFLQQIRKYAVFQVHQAIDCFFARAVPPRSSSCS